MNIVFEVAIKIRSVDDSPTAKPIPEMPKPKRAAFVANLMGKVAAHPLAILLLREIHRN